MYAYCTIMIIVYRPSAIVAAAFVLCISAQCNQSAVAVKQR